LQPWSRCSPGAVAALEPFFPDLRTQTLGMLQVRGAESHCVAAQWMRAFGLGLNSTVQRPWVPQGWRW
jgi:hypothetical protein